MSFTKPLSFANETCRFFKWIFQQSAPLRLLMDRCCQALFKSYDDPG
jgi:hypothetical protein